MDGGLVTALFFVFSIGGTVGLVYYYYHTRHKERMMLIEKGADAKLFQTEPKKKNYFFTIVLGIVFISIGTGIILGFALSSLVHEWGWSRHSGEPLPYFVSIFLTIGAGFIASFFASKKLNN